MWARNSLSQAFGLLLKASAQTLLTIAANPKHLGARIGMTSVLHTSHQKCVSICLRRAFGATGSATTHHPHLHVIVPVAGCRQTAHGGSATNPASSCR